MSDLDVTDSVDQGDD